MQGEFLDDFDLDEDLDEAGIVARLKAGDDGGA